MYLLEVKNVNKKFGGLVVSNNIDFKVKEGQIYGVIGPNGAGKSTLFNQISGYVIPDSGQIIFNGKDITGVPPNKLCLEGIGRTFQIVKPFGNKTVLYNVAVGAFARTNSREEAYKIAEQVVQQVGLNSKKDFLAKNLTIVDRKRLEIAKALATQPKILLLDEVLAGLTPSEVDDAIELIKQLRDSGITILMIEHVMRAVMALCEYVLVIGYGTEISRGLPEEVTQDPEVIKAYLGVDDEDVEGE